MPTVHSSVLVGVDVVPVRLEAVCSPGFTGLHILGLPAEWARDARERARVALEGCGHRLDERKVVVQVSCEASVKLARSAPSLLDFALCAVVLLALKESQEGKDDALDARLAAHPLHLVGEVLLSGEVTAGGAELFCEAAVLVAPPTHDVCLPALSSPSDSTRVRCLTFTRLSAFAQWVARGCSRSHDGSSPRAASGADEALANDGALSAYEAHVVASLPQVLASWGRVPRLGLALSLALAGRFHLFVLGSPGIGKTHALSFLATLLPPLDARERIERRLIQCGTSIEDALGQRPFRAPQHTCSVAGLVGNAHLAPGEFTLAHRGTLFLDEFLEFSRTKLESLREPLEGKRVHLARAQGSLSLPADFQLLAAANPCRCGHFLSRRKGCRCLPRERAKAWAPLSGPLLDRFTVRFALTDEPDAFADNPYVTTFTALLSDAPRRDAFAARLAHATARAHGWGRRSLGFEACPRSVPFLEEVLADALAPNLRARVQWDALLTAADTLFPELARTLPVEERLASLAHLRDLEGILEHALLYETLPPKDVKSVHRVSIAPGCAERVRETAGASA